jgi:hypothetical protein
MKHTSKDDLPKWRVTKIAGARAQELGELRAKTADAIKRYAKEFGVTDPHQRSRLAAYRVA